MENSTGITESICRTEETIAHDWAAKNDNSVGWYIAVLFFIRGATTTVAVAVAEQQQVQLSICDVDYNNITTRDYADDNELLVE